MMRRLSHTILLAFCIASVASCGLVTTQLPQVESKREPALIVVFSGAQDQGANTSSSLTLNAANVQVNDFGNACLMLSGGSPSTFTSGWTQIGSTLTEGGGTLSCYKKTLVSGDIGASVGATYSSSYSWFRLWVTRGTDGVAPTIDGTPAFVGGASVTSITIGSTTTTQAGDLVFWMAGGTASGCGGFSSVPVMLGVGAGSTKYGYFGQSVAGASPTATFGCSSGNLFSVAIGVKASGPGVVMVGPGSESTNGSTTSVTPTVTPFGNSGDVAIAAISELATSGVAITPPPDLFQRGSSIVSCYGVGGYSAGGYTLTVPAVVEVGDMMTLQTASDTTLSGTGPSNWTSLYTTNVLSNKFTFWYRVATSGDTGGAKTYVWTNSGASFMNVGYAAFYSASGAALSIDASTVAAQTSSTTTYTSPTITTDITNTLNVLSVQRAIAGAITYPSPLTATFDKSAACGSGEAIYPQAALGTSIAPVLSDSSGSWAVGQAAIKSATGAASPWHQLGSAIVEPGGTKELDLYWALYTAALPTNFGFGSAINASGIIFDLGGIDTTTPFDVECPLGIGSMTNPMFPACTPTPADELWFRFSTTGYPWSGPGYTWRDILFANSTSGIEAVVDPLANAGAETVTGQGVSAPASSVTLGLNAATSPTHATANARLNLEVLEVFTTTLPAAPPAAAFEEVISLNQAGAN